MNRQQPHLSCRSPMGMLHVRPCSQPKPASGRCHGPHPKQSHASRNQRCINGGGRRAAILAALPGCHIVPPGRAQYLASISVTPRRRRPPTDKIDACATLSPTRHLASQNCLIPSATMRKNMSRRCQPCTNELCSAVFAGGSEGMRGQRRRRLWFHE